MELDFLETGPLEIGLITYFSLLEISYLSILIVILLDYLNS